MGVSQPNHGVSIKLLVSKKPPVKFACEQKECVQDIGSNSEGDLTKMRTT